MESIQLGTMINKKVKKAMEEVCRSRGVKISSFIEEAVLDKLEELEDLENLKSLRKEPSRSLDEIIKDLKAHGKI